MAGQPPIKQPRRTIKMIVYNADYPPVLTFDATFVNPMRPYRFADLANTLPPGIFLHPLVNLQNKIFEIGMPNDNGEEQEDDQMEKIEKMKEIEKMQNKMKKDQKKTASGAGTPAGGAGDKK